MEVIPIWCECSFNFVKYRKALKFLHKIYLRVFPALKATETVDFVEAIIRAETQMFFSLLIFLGVKTLTWVWFSLTAERAFKNKDNCYLCYLWASIYCISEPWLLYFRKYINMFFFLCLSFAFLWNLILSKQTLFISHHHG